MRLYWREKPIDRFLDKLVVLDDEQGGCWQRQACIDRGYGRFGIRRGLTVWAYVFAYEHFVGPVPAGLVVDHLCRNRACVNPAHLEAVTASENVLRGAGPTACNARKTHCPEGHKYTPENTYVIRHANGKQSRRCRTCALDRYHRVGRDQRRARTARLA